MTGKERGGFLSRWSERKAGERGEPEAPAIPESPPANEDARSDDEILAALGLPDPETLEPGADFAAFMAAAVPERIRQRALHRLWRSNPVLHNLDGLVDHGEDYTARAMVRPDLRTAYKVGRGIWREATREPPAAAEETPESPSRAQPEQRPEPAEMPEPEPPQEPRHRRRMRFAVDEPPRRNKTHLSDV